MIFSYLDVHHRAIDYLKRLNSKGYDISKSNFSKQMFEVYLKSQLMCHRIKEFEENEIFLKMFEDAKTLEIQKKRAQEFETTIGYGLVGDAIQPMRSHLFSNDSHENTINTNFMFDDKEKLKQSILQVTQIMPNIQMVNIELYCDGNYPRGISVLYQIDGQKTFQVSNIRQGSSE